MEFWSHNVELRNGNWTAPDLGRVVESDLFKATLHELIETGDILTVADLGSLEGGYAYELAKRGWTATGIEARQENHEAAVWLKEQYPLLPLEFECADVRDALRGRKFDAILCSGLLYHMDRPVNFLRELGAATRKLLIINTQVSMQGGHDESIHHPGSYCDYSDDENEGYHGHRYYESSSRWDAYGNATSFWLRPEELMRALREEAGFECVSELVNWREGPFKPHIPGGAPPIADRRMFTAVKP